MIEQHAEIMAGLRPGMSIEVEGIRSFVREEIIPRDLHGWRRVAAGLCEWVDGMLVSFGPCIFKIGITHNPYHRMHNPRYGYACVGELYRGMQVLVFSYPGVCAWLEKALISFFASRPGCRNVAGGGESAPEEGVCYLYLVHQFCGDGQPLRWGRRAA